MPGAYLEAEPGQILRLVDQRLAGGFDDGLVGVAEQGSDSVEWNVRELRAKPSQWLVELIPVHRSPPGVVTTSVMAASRVFSETVRNVQDRA
jgi:hypothetical protein